MSEVCLLCLLLPDTLRTGIELSRLARTSDVLVSIVIGRCDSENGSKKHYYLEKMNIRWEGMGCQMRINEEVIKLLVKYEIRNVKMARGNHASGLGLTSISSM